MCPAATTLCVAGTCEPLPANLPTAGQLIITEVMGDPVGVDSMGEWIEIYNTTDTQLALFSLVIEDDESLNGQPLGQNGAHGLRQRIRTGRRSRIVVAGDHAANGDPRVDVQELEGRALRSLLTSNLSDTATTN